MKVALCLSGQMRTYRQCYGNLKRYIIETLKPDIFVHTWSYAGISTKASSDVKEKLTDDRVTYDNLDKLYSPKLAVIEDFRDSYTGELAGVKVPGLLRKSEPQHYKGSIPMFYKIYECNELKNNWEEKNNFRYDLVIRLRPDLLVLENIPDKALKKPGILWFSDCRVNPKFQVSDKFAISSSGNMDYYCSVWKNLAKYWENPCGDGRWENHRVGERLMKIHLEQSGIVFMPFFISCDILRNPLYLDPHGRLSSLKI